MAKHTNQRILAGLILAGLAGLSIQVPSLAPWFIGWLLAGTALSLAYKRNQPKLIAVSLLAIVILVGLGLYPRWQSRLADLEASGNGPAQQVAKDLQRHAGTHAGRLPAPNDPFWSEARQRLTNSVRQAPIGDALRVVEVPHQAALVTAPLGLETDPAQAGGVTVFLTENHLFVIASRDAKGVPSPFDENLSNLRQARLGLGEARAVDQGIPGNRAAASDSQP